MVTIKDFKASRVEMTPLQYCNIYLTPQEVNDHFSKDCIKVHVYLHGFYITEHLDRKFILTLENRSFVSGEMESLEERLWNDFAERECNPSITLDRLEELKTEMQKLYDAHSKILKMWDEDERINDILEVGYPYPVSFDELLADLGIWVDSVQELINLKRNRNV